MSKEEKKKVEIKESEKEKTEERRPEERGIEPWYPRDVRELDEMLEDLRRNFWRDFWGPFPPRRYWERHLWPRGIEPYTRRREANLDLIDRGKEFEIRFEAPGIPKENIDINITKDGIEISGKAAVEKREEEKNYMIRERGYTEIYRRLAFPDEVIPEKATATLRNGLLEIRVPKRTPTPEEKRHKVEIV